MKRLINFAGGRGLVNDDLQSIQESLDNLMAIYKVAGPFVIHGVDFTVASGSVYDVSAGLVFLNNRVIEFPAQQIDLTNPKAIAQSTAADVDSRQYSGLGISQAGARQYGVVINSGTNPTQPGDNIFITSPSGGFLPQVRRMRHALQEIMLVPGMLMPVANQIVAKFIGAFDLSGRDEWFGWKLRTAAPAPVNPVDLRDDLLIGAGGALSVGDDIDLNVTTGPTLLARATAVHFAEFVGTRATATTFV